MSDTTTEKKTRNPRTLETISIAASKLSLKDRAELIKKLQESVAAEVEFLESEYNAAKGLLNG